MQILLGKFHYMRISLCINSILQTYKFHLQISLCEILLCGFQCENFIMCKFYCLSSNMQILSNNFYCISCNVQIPLCGFQYVNSIVCKFYRMQILLYANFIARIRIIVFPVVYSIVFFIVYFIIRFIMYSILCGFYYMNFYYKHFIMDILLYLIALLPVHSIMYGIYCRDFIVRIIMQIMQL